MSEAAASVPRALAAVADQPRVHDFLAQAIAEGRLDADRLASYKKLEIELGYQGLSARQLEQEKISRMMSGVGGIKQFRAIVKNRNKR